jgi:hypothetical protein
MTNLQTGTWYYDEIERRGGFDSIPDSTYFHALGPAYLSRLVIHKNIRVAPRTTKNPNSFMDEMILL